MTNPISRIAGLDGLRALSVAAVVWDHMYVKSNDFPILARGYLGVDVFFILSGFLITHLLLQERATRGRICLRRFYLRRTLRIFPLYFLVIGLVALYFTFVGEPSQQKAAFVAELPHHLTYTSNWIPLNTMMGITWSLSTEEQFYLIWPPLLVVFETVAVGLVIGFLLFNQAINFRVLDEWFASVGFPFASLEVVQCTFTPILFGVLLACAKNVPRYSGFLSSILRSRILAATLVVLVLICANWEGEIRSWPRLFIQLGMALLLARIVLYPHSGSVKALDWAPLAYIGSISYGIYLLHVLVLHVVGEGLSFAGITSTTLLFAGTFLGSVLVAGVSYKYFEQPILKFKDRFH